MIRILDRLVITSFFKLFGVILLVASPTLFILADVTENLDIYVDRGLTLGEVARAYVYQYPLFMQMSFPIAALVAAVFTIHGMTVHRELVAAKAGGISFHRVASPLIVLGVLLTGVALGLTELIPRGNRIAAQILRDEDPRRSWRADFVYQSEDQVTWQVGRLTATDGRMSNVVLERAPRPDLPGVHIIADAAEHDSVGGWTFARGYLRSMRPDSTERAYQFERLRMAGINERPEELLEAPRAPEEMTYAEIDRLADIIQRTGGDANELLVKREQKLTIPAATLVVILLGLPLATSSKRGGAAYGIGVSLGLTMAYILLLRVAGALGEAGAVDPQLAAWTPNALFFAAGAVMLTRVRT